MLLRNPALWCVVRIQVALAVAQDVSTAIVRVPQVDGNRTGSAVAHRLGRSTDRVHDAVRLRREAQVDDGMREVDRGFGEADVFDRPSGGVRDEQRLWI